MADYFHNKKTDSSEGFPLLEEGEKAQEASGAQPQCAFSSPPAPGTPITTQPTSQEGADNEEWVDRPQTIPNCPAGLEYLTLIDELFVYQQKDLTGIDFFGYQIKDITENRYVITNRVQQKAYYAMEESDYWERNCWGSERPFKMKILDNFGNEVIRMQRLCACKYCCCFCCLQSIEICAPAGNVLGRVEQQWSFMFSKFLIKDASGEVVLLLRGPWCEMSCGDVNFRVFSADGATKIGRIYKKWLEYDVQGSSDENVYGVSFPMDLDVRMKAVLLGACFLINMMFFEIKLKKR